MHAVDISTPTDPHVLMSLQVPGVPNDIAVCGGFVAVTIRNESVPLQGWVGLYTTYDKNLDHILKIREIPGKYEAVHLKRWLEYWIIRFK